MTNNDGDNTFELSTNLSSLDIESQYLSQNGYFLRHQWCKSFEGTETDGPFQRHAQSHLSMDSDVGIPFV